MHDIQKLVEELQTIVNTLNIPMSQIGQERCKIAIEIQRNKILQEGLDNIYDILYDIRFNKHY